MADFDDFLLTDGVDYPQAAHIMQLRNTSFRSEYINTESISATKELTDNDLPYQVITCSSTDQIVELAAEATSNHPFLIYNTTPSSDGYSLSVKDDSGATTYAILEADEWAMFKQVNGEGWKAVSSNLAVTCISAGSYIAFNPADATTYYVGLPGFADPSTSGGNRSITLPSSGTITRVDFNVSVATTTATTETFSAWVRVNDTTDTLISSSCQADQVYETFSNGSLSIAVQKGDTLEIKLTTPSWSTNPTSVRFLALIWMKSIL